MPVHASDTITTEPDSEIYNYVSYYEVKIDAPAKDVWPVLKNLGSWMYEFEMSSVSGESGKEGEVLRLYPGQDFFVQVTKIVPSRLLVVANLPATFKGETSTGVGTIILHEHGEQSVVSMAMSRRYSWLGEGGNPMKATRQSSAFAEGTKVMWQDRFLGKLKTLAENTTP